MRIAILIGHFPPGSFGGAEIQAEEWARRLAPRHEVVVITRRDPPTQSVEELRDGFRILRLPVERLPLWRTIADLRAIERTILAMPEPPQLILCFQTFISGLAGALVHRRTGIPSVVWIRGEAEYRLGDSVVRRWLAPWTWRHSRAVLVQSEQNRLDLLQSLRAYAPSSEPVVAPELRVIGNGVELPDELTGPGDRVLSVGRLIHDKGMDVLIRAAAAAGVPLTIAGDGPERGALQALAGDLGADCRFVGRVSRATLDELYRSASVVVLAARRGEGLPNVLLEAMSFARPVVATPCAGIRDLLVEGENGWLVPPDDVPALQATLVRLHADPSSVRRAGERARKRAEASSWDRWSAELEAGLELWGSGS